jgi:disulfide bond formation protein DsbB
VKPAPFSPRPLSIGILTAFFGSGSLLMGAYAFQYLGGLMPCHMCWWQRYAHWVLFGLGCAGLLALIRKVPRTTRLLVWLALLAALASCALALWHAGVEYKWWPGPGGCSAQIMTGSIEDISRQMVMAPVVLCDAPAWQLFGISMAGYNFLASTGMALVIAAVLRRTRDDIGSPGQTSR